MTTAFAEDSGRKFESNRGHDLLNVYETGTGQLIFGVHAKTAECEQHGCTVHNPTDPHHPTWPTRWSREHNAFMRVCPHGVQHPDQDEVAWRRRHRSEWDVERALDHECDGCCSTPNPEE